VFVSAGVSQDSKPPPDGGTSKVRLDTVKGGLYHSSDDWTRITGKVKVKNGYAIVLPDGKEVELGTGPELEQLGKIGDEWYPAGREAAEFLRELVGDQTVTVYVRAKTDEYKRGEVTTGLCFIGETNLGAELIRNGWAFARHSSVVATEIMARENKRGLWRGQFVPPDEWRRGKRLPGENAARGRMKPAGRAPAVVGTWEVTAFHATQASLFQLGHGVRKRTAKVRFAQDGDRLSGHAVSTEHVGEEGPIVFRALRFADDRLAFEYEIKGWTPGAGPIAVEDRRLPNRGTLRAEARLTGDRLVGWWGLFTADGAEVFRGEWEATRAKKADKP
jgi:hypothetical protein